MYNQSQKPQVRYSLDSLSDALYRLMEHKPISEITVTEICREAGIARRTYYRNCQHPEDLIAYQIRKKVSSNLALVNFQCEDGPVLYRQFFEYWYDQRSFLQITFEQGFSMLFFQEFTDICNQDMDYRLLSEFLEGKSQQQTLRLFHNAFLVGGLCNLLGYWIHDGFSASVDILVDIMAAHKPASSAMMTR